MSRQSRERLIKALEESRWAEKEIMGAEVRKDNEQSERIVDLLQHAPEHALSCTYTPDAYFSRSDRLLRVQRGRSW